VQPGTRHGIVSLRSQWQKKILAREERVSLRVAKRRSNPVDVDEIAMASSLRSGASG